MTCVELSSLFVDRVCVCVCLNSNIYGYIFFAFKGIISLEEKTQASLHAVVMDLL